MISTRVADRYVLLTPLGSGGEARVFRACDERNKTDIALRLALGPVASVVSAAPTFAHKNWVRFIDSGIDPQHGAYQVFELLEGRTLGAIAGSAPLSREEWRTFADESLAAVEAVHLANWVHGDINADNFIRTASSWKLLELPFYRFEAPAGRSTMFGSIYTLAPEQINGGKPSISSDLYSLGCLYYYAACGKWLHPGNTIQQIAIERLTRGAPPLQQHAPAFPPAWADWVMKLLAASPSDRFSSAATAHQLLADAVA